MREGLVVLDEKYKGRLQQRATRPVVNEQGQKMRRMFPRRTWSVGKREQWLPEEEAKAWAAMRYWSVTQWRVVQVEDDKGGNSQMAMGLVIYRGRRRGSFSQRVERYPVRVWSAVDVEERERWLPIAEAEAWDRMRDWQLKERKIIREEVVTQQFGGVAMAPPATPAMPLDQVLADARRITQTVKRTLEEVAAKEELQFCVSDSGVVHKRGCVSWPKYPAGEFATFGEAINNGQAQRPHQLCCREAMALDSAMRRLEDEDGDREGAVAQMNALGESYGQGADTA